jgi:hypothetical protein
MSIFRHLTPAQIPEHTQSSGSHRCPERSVGNDTVASELA